MTSGVNLPFHRFSFRILYFKFDWVGILLEIQKVEKILNKRVLGEINFLNQIAEIRIPFLVR